MSYVGLKHLLADLALEAVRNPAAAGWVAIAAAYAELAAEEHLRVLQRDCLKHATVLAAPFGWQPSEADVRWLIRSGLFTEHLELIALPDPFLPHLAYFKRHAPRLLKALAALAEGNGSFGGPPEVRVGTALFNAGLFFECHEWFEGLWKVAEGERKEFFHGIVQVAAAFYHYEKGNRHGCGTLLRKGRRRLAPYPAHFLGVDLARFERELADWAAHFEGGARSEHYPLLPPAADSRRRKQQELRGGMGERGGA